MHACLPDGMDLALLCLLLSSSVSAQVADDE